MSPDKAIQMSGYRQRFTAVGSGIYTGRCSLSLFTEYYDIYKEKCQ